MARKSIGIGISSLGYKKQAKLAGELKNTTGGFNLQVQQPLTGAALLLRAVALRD
jgi:hypothetical protein